MGLEIMSVERGGRVEDRGVNHRARLAIAPEKIAEHSPFLLMAEDWFAPPAGFPTHPHRGMETVTFVLEGELLHKDHTGGEGRLRAGDAQFMTAGGGVLHSEMPGPGGVRSLQLWLNLPARLKRTQAGYRDVRLADAVLLRGDGTEARLYTGRLGEVAIPRATAWPMTLVDATLEPGATLALAASAGERAFALILEGEALLGANTQKISVGEVAWAAVPGQDTSLVASAPSGRTRLLFYASPVIDEPVAMAGPFVMNTREEILEAFADLRAGRLTAPSERSPRFDFDQKAEALTSD
jgi:quercetin 2,3-dioxygenase